VWARRRQTPVRGVGKFFAAGCVGAASELNRTLAAQATKVGIVIICGVGRRGALAARRSGSAQTDNQGVEMSNLLKLMKQLGADAALNDEYKKDPSAVIARYNLSDKERDALLNKDYEAIKKLTGLQDGQYSTNSTIKAYDS